MSRLETFRINRRAERSVHRKLSDDDFELV